MTRAKQRMNSAPWIIQVFNGRTPTHEEVVWMVGMLLQAQELRDEHDLREFQQGLTPTLGTILPDLGGLN